MNPLFILLCLLSSLLAISNATAAEPRSALWQTTEQHLQFQPESTTNSLRGLHRWRGQERIPQTAAARDAYQRYEWRTLEPAQGQYDFSRIRADLNTAKANGQRFAFRLRMMIGYDDDTAHLPNYLINHANCSAGCGWWADYDAAQPGLTFVPDWNDAFVQLRAQRLLKALAAALGTDQKHLAWIDIGLYGQYGEWTLSSRIDYQQAPAGIVPISDASKRAFVDMHLAAFPRVQQVMFALYGNYTALEYAFHLQTIGRVPVGLRIDCLGKASFMNQWLHRPAAYELIRERWQVAPFVAEFCPFGTTRPIGQHSPADALEQVRTLHISSVGNGNLGQDWQQFSASEQEAFLALADAAGYRYQPVSSSVTLTSLGTLNLTLQIDNTGNAPVYDAVNVRAELWDANGQRVWTALIGQSLKQSLGEHSRQDIQLRKRLPKALAAGSYQLTVRAYMSRSGQALHWAAAEALDDGSVQVAQLVKLP